MTPGFITDIFGFALLIPPIRAALRKLLLATRPPGRPGPFGLLPLRPPPDAWRAARGTPPPGGRRPSPGPPPRQPGRDYDFEGSAREIPTDGPELDPGKDG